MPALSGFLLLFLLFHPGSPAYEMVPPTFRAGHSPLADCFLNALTYTKKGVIPYLLDILSLINLTIRIALHKFTSCQLDTEMHLLFKFLY
jgi:hypothetical protein